MTLPEPAKKDADNESDPELKNLPCVWPGCNKPQKILINLPVLKKQDGNLVQIPDRAVPTPFCFYHRWIAVSGLCAVLAKNDSLTDLEFIAPFDAIKAAEAVNLASFMTNRMEVETHGPAENTPSKCG